MSKVITFSRTFPAHHPKKGQPTYFVEKIWQSLFNNSNYEFGGARGLEKELEIFSNPSHFIKPKGHTIRAGHRWKAGDKFSPRVWSGQPYRSKQIIIAPDIEIKKVWKIIIHRLDNSYLQCVINYEASWDFEELAKNDGLIIYDFKNWFCLSPSFVKTKFFSGQIVCWDENIKY